MLWDLGNKKGRTFAQPIIASQGSKTLNDYYNFARIEDPHRLLHNKDRNNIENHKMKEEKNDRNGSEQ